MKRIIGITLAICSLGIFVVLLIAINSKHPVNIVETDTFESTLIKYCKEIYGELSEEEGIFILSIRDMKDIYDKDVSIFMNEEDNCDLDLSMVKAYVSEGALNCEPQLNCQVIK